ncbi:MULTISPECIES: hypothetical protein [Streptomyces]|uniref:Transposase n=2 Tax=Streptomyces TaxID=1883 RepID=A0ABV9J5Z8_9ACTN
MLLQTDRYRAQGASTVGIRTAEKVPGPGSPAGSRPVKRDRWLVGLRFHTAGSQPVWLYYVVDDVWDTTHAVRMAVQRADSDRDRAVRGGPQAEADQIEVRRILRDALGRYRLSRCPDAS